MTRSTKGEIITKQVVVKKMSYRVTADGWAVDRIENRKFGWYGYGDDGSPENLGNLTPLVPGSMQPYQVAILHDIASSAEAFANVTWEYQTYAIDKSGQDKGKVYGGLSWGFDVDALAKLKSQPRQFLATATAAFKDAVKAWNQQAMGPIAKRNANDQVPLGPFWW